MNPLSHFILGLQYPLKGLRYLRHPTIRRFAVVPICLNIILFVALFFLLQGYHDQLTTLLQPYLPSWLSFLETLLTGLFILLGLIILLYGFTLGAALLASPFCGLLAEVIENHYSKTQPTESHWSEFIADIPRTIKREWHKMLYHLPRLFLLALLLLLPLVNLIIPLLAFLYTAWMMSVQYLDYPMDNHQISFKDMLDKMKQYRLLSLGFGLSTIIMALIPIVNFVLIPACVSGATLLYCDYWLENRDLSTSVSPV